MAALADDGACVGCSARPGPLLEDVRAKAALRNEKENENG